jgi:N6-L-threonylcarbamoyladenine synthase
MDKITVLAIETSCDETAVAILDNDKNIIINNVFSQMEHLEYGGVVPEIAARSHLDVLDLMITNTMKQVNYSFDDIDIIGVTGGPGLIGGVIVGVMTAKAIASVTKKPLICVNHLEGHALTARLTSDIEFPFLLLLVSGGHCQILICYGVSNYQLLGKTIDDAIGESFDKVAKMLGLAYPGGPIIEKMAKLGDATRFKFPRPLIDRKNCDFSLSGLKTSVRREIEKLGEVITMQDKHDICASFQTTIGDIIINRLSNALALSPGVNNLVIAGGVAANQYIKKLIQDFADNNNLSLVVPPVKLCTDNAAMIGWAAIEKFKLNMIDDMSFEPRANWPLYKNDD